MSQVATETGIGRATLYKYFPDVEAILAAWHERQIARHLRISSPTSATRPTAPPGNWKPCSTAYAIIQPSTTAPNSPRSVHRGEHIARAQKQLHA